jgi:hypothetical protein
MIHLLSYGLDVGRSLESRTTAVLDAPKENMCIIFLIDVSGRVAVVVVISENRRAWRRGVQRSVGVQSRGWRANTTEKIQWQASNMPRWHSLKPSVDSYAHYEDHVQEYALEPCDIPAMVVSSCKAGGYCVDHVLPILHLKGTI